MAAHLFELQILETRLAGKHSEMTASARMEMTILADEDRLLTRSSREQSHQECMEARPVPNSRAWLVNLTTYAVVVFQRVEPFLDSAGFAFVEVAAGLEHNLGDYAPARVFSCN